MLIDQEYGNILPLLGKIVEGLLDGRVLRLVVTD